MQEGGLYQRYKDAVKQSMALKFMIALSGWIAVIMIAGTLFVTRVLLDAEERNIQKRGREIGAVLAKASIDRLVANDLMGLNLFVGDVVRSGEAIAILIVNADGVPITNTRASFDALDDDIKEVLAATRTENVSQLADEVRLELQPVEVAVPVTLESTRLGTVHLFFPRSAVWKSALNIVLLLAGTSIVIVLSLALLLYKLVQRTIVMPITAVVTVTTGVAEGNLTESITVSSNDEIGYLGRGVNRMIVGLTSIIASVRASSTRLQEVSGDVTAVAANVTAAGRVQSESVEEAASSVNEMHYTLQEIATTAEDLNDTAEQTASAVIETAASVDEVARTMNELSSSIEETSTAITQMSAAIASIAENVEILSRAADDTASSVFEVSTSVRQVEDHAKESATLAEAVSADAQQIGMRSIEKTREGMRRIEEETRRSADVINRLGTRAENIGGILTVIEDITDQTSLLALNAAILAAQAGEQGKGFAVVASEIRDLANRTAASTQEIGMLIQSVQEETREAVEVMQKSVLLAEEGTRLVQDTGDAFRKITERAEHARAMSHTISSAAAAQSAGMRQVSDAVDRINQMAHQIAKAAAEQRGGSEQIIRASEKMREITRFVRSATAEQVKASRTITDAMEAVTTRVGFVNRAAGEVRTGSDLIVKAIERIKLTARENTELSTRLSGAVAVMAEQTAALKNEIARFNISGEGG